MAGGFKNVVGMVYPARHAPEEERQVYIDIPKLTNLLCDGLYGDRGGLISVNEYLTICRKTMVGLHFSRSSTRLRLQS